MHYETKKERIDYCKWDDQVWFIFCLQVSVVNGLIIIMLIVGVHHVMTSLTVCRGGEVAGVWSNLKHYLMEKSTNDYENMNKPPISLY